MLLGQFLLCLLKGDCFVVLQLVSKRLQIKIRLKTSISIIPIITPNEYQLERSPLITGSNKYGKSQETVEIIFELSIFTLSGVETDKRACTKGEQNDLFASK